MKRSVETVRHDLIHVKIIPSGWANIWISKLHNKYKFDTIRKASAAIQMSFQ